MLSTYRGLLISELASFLRLSPQTIRKGLKSSGFMVDVKRVGRSLVIPEDVATDFIRECYPSVLVDFTDRYTEGKALKQTEYQVIPKSIGVITSVLQKSGNRYYYIKNFPLYYDNQGKPIYYKGKGFISKVEAENQRNKLIRQRTNGEFKTQYLNGSAEESVTTLAERIMKQSYVSFCREFFTNRDNQAATKELYLAIINGPLESWFGGIKVRELTVEDLQDYLDTRDSSIKNHMVILRQTLQRLSLIGAIRCNYAERLVRPQINVKRYTKEALTCDEVTAIRKVIVGSPNQWAIELLLASGMRIGELQALRPEDVEILNGNRALIHITGSWGKISSSEYGRKDTKTTTSRRDVPIGGTNLITLLQSAKLKAKGKKWLFINRSGTGPIEKHNFNRYLSSVATQAGITKRLTSHVFRHTLASIMKKKRVPDTTIARFLGHANVETLNRVYAHDISSKEELFEIATDLYKN